MAQLRWCARCLAPHGRDEVCPKKVPWDKSFGNALRSSGRGGKPWQKKREKVFVRDNFLCQQCRRDGRFTPVELHGFNAGICDHIVPLAEGGTDGMNNLETLCQPCDKVKTAAESLRGRGYRKV